METPQKHFPLDTTVVFLPGMHNLSAENHIVIQDVRNLSLRGLESSMSGFAKNQSHIVCTNASGFLFLNVTSLEIANLTISQCGDMLSASILAEIIKIARNVVCELHRS